MTTKTKANERKGRGRKSERSSERAGEENGREKASNNFTLELSSNGSEKFISMVIQAHSSAFSPQCVSFGLSNCQAKWIPCACLIFKTININRQTTASKGSSGLCLFCCFCSCCCCCCVARNATPHTYKTFLLWLQHKKKMNRIFIVWNLLNLCYQVSSSACIFFCNLFFSLSSSHFTSPLLEFFVQRTSKKQKKIQQAEKSAFSVIRLTYSFTAFFAFVVVFVFFFVGCLSLFFFISLLRFYARTQDIKCTEQRIKI